MKFVMRKTGLKRVLDVVMIVNMLRLMLVEDAQSAAIKEELGLVDGFQLNTILHNREHKQGRVKMSELDRFHRKFKSGNKIPVPQAVIKKDEYDAVVARIAEFEHTVSGMCRRQYNWVERMGWHNGTVLEKLALIASEVGEAVNECRGDEPTEEFGIELADICLRVFDLAHEQGINLEQCILDKMEINEKRGTRGRRI